MAKTRIAIDASCDGGPAVVAEGVKRALAENSNLEIILVAGKDKLVEVPFLDIPSNLPIIETERTYNYEIRKNKDISIYRALEMHEAGEVDAVIAPGDTIGSVQTATKVLGLMKHIESPAIATSLPFESVLVDVGANPNSGHKEMLQSAVMGYVLSKYHLKVQQPKIALATLGEEESKWGKTIILKARNLITKLCEKNKEYSLYHNIHPKKIYGTCHVEGNFLHKFKRTNETGVVVVTDGFTGNLLLKCAEGCFSLLLEEIKREFENQPKLRKIAAAYGLEDVRKNIKQKYDYRNYATAPLLGVNGKVMICHGSSTIETIANSFQVAKDYLNSNLNPHLEEELEKYRKL